MKMKIEFETKEGVRESFEVMSHGEDHGLIVFEREYVLSFNYKEGYKVWKRAGNVLFAIPVELKWFKLEIQY